MIALLAVLGAVTGLAGVPLHDGVGSQIVRSHRAVFVLPDGWARLRSDTYASGVRMPGGLTCRLLLTTRAALRHAPPARDFAVEERGRAGTLRWHLGTTDRGLRAIAQRRAPPSLRTTRRPYAGYEMTLTAEAGETCVPAAVKQRGVLRSAIRSIRLTRS